MLLPNDPEPAVGGSIFLCNFSGTVVRTVVHADDFNVTQRLARDRIQALPQIRRDIIDRNDYRYLGAGGIRLHEAKSGQIRSSCPRKWTLSAWSGVSSWPRGVPCVIIVNALTSFGKHFPP